MVTRTETNRWIRLKKPVDIPDLPGVYLFYDGNDLPIYIGKAKSLRRRLLSYWGKKTKKEGRILEYARSLDFIVTDNEIEALILEGNLIKQYRPRLNVNLKDDKSYPNVKITREGFPRIYITRNKVDDGASYYGPYTNVDDIKRSLKILKGIFGIRNCKKKIKNNPSDYPCLNYHIERCSGPCSGLIGEREYNKNVRMVEKFLKGYDIKNYEIELERKLSDHISNKEFEKATIIRDDLLSLRTLREEQKMELDFVDDDIVNFEIKGNIALMVVFTMREGKLIGKNTYKMYSDQGIDEQELMVNFLRSRYQKELIKPKRIILPVDIEDPSVEEWLGEISDGKISIWTPQRGRFKKMLSLVKRNAQIIINEEIWKNNKERNVYVSRKLSDILSVDYIKTIEAIDISNFGDRGTVGGLVRFEDGVPDKQYYRRYRIKDNQASDDITRMIEVVGRRFTREFPPQPDLLLIDGGRGHLNAVYEKLKSIEVDNLTLLAIAKGERDKIYDTDGENIVQVDLDDEVLNFLSLIRDEAHRFAIQYQRKVRDFGETVLSGIEGIGENKVNEILKKFRSVDEILNADIDEIEEVKGIGKVLAKKIYNRLRLEVRKRRK